MIIPDDHAQLVTTYSAPNHSELLSFTFGCYVDGVAGGADDVANRWFDIWKDNCQSLMANEYQVLEVTAYYRQGADLFVGVSDRAAYNGTLGVGAESPSVSFLLRKNTGLAGRKFRGRAFVPQPRADDVDGGGNVLAAQLTNWATAGAGLLADASDNGIFGWAMPLRLLHSDATAPTAITSITCDPVVGVQRRRQR